MRFTVRPEDAVARLHGRTNPICYVLERRSVTDLAVLQNACVTLQAAAAAEAARAAVARAALVLLSHAARSASGTSASTAVRRPRSCR